ncbi:thermonuclease family protein [Mycoplasmopsis gallinarum]|nr:thermonuclease family protein [Mycoplasmopsis gallinarum]
MKRKWVIFTNLMLNPLCLSCATSNYATNKEYKLKDYEIIDGDTIYCKMNNQYIGLRIFGIDTPEIKKSNDEKLALKENYYGQKAKQELIRLLKWKVIKIKILKIDKYQRKVVILKNYQNVDVAMQLLKKGLARVKYVSLYKYSKPYWIVDDKLIEYYYKMVNLENEARKLNLGIWKENLKYVFHKN